MQPAVETPRRGNAQMRPVRFSQEESVLLKLIAGPIPLPIWLSPGS